MWLPSEKELEDAPKAIRLRAGFSMMEQITADENFSSLYLGQRADQLDRGLSKHCEL